MKARLSALLLVALGLLPAARLEAAPFIRGDADGNGVLQLTDPIRILGYLFLGSPALIPCLGAADGNDDGMIEVSDPIFLLRYLFLGGPQPPAPFPGCGEDPNWGLGCASYGGCSVDDIQPPVVVGPNGCTEMGCPDLSLVLYPGGLLDLLRNDGCNDCSSLPQVTDDRGIAAVRIQLLASSDPSMVAFDLEVPVQGSVIVQLDMDGVTVCGPGDSLCQAMAYPGDGLRLPDNLEAGVYIRRILAVDLSGKQASSDTAVRVETSPYEPLRSDKERQDPAVPPGDVASVVAQDVHRRRRGGDRGGGGHGRHHAAHLDPPGGGGGRPALHLPDPGHPHRGGAVPRPGGRSLRL